MRFFFISVLLLVIGLKTEELGSFLWGGLFVFLTAYFWLGALMGRKALRCIPPKQRLSFSPLYPESHSKVKVSFSSPILPFLLPGFFCVFRLQARHSSTRSLEWRWRLVRSYPPEFILSAPRGAYFLKSSYEIHDILGFSYVKHLVSIEESLIILPSSTVDTSSSRHAYSVPEDFSQQKQKNPYQDHLDVRKYFPGDDIKRIHWGLFAHAGEPFLRISDETRNQRQRHFFVIDTSTLQQNDERALDFRLEQVNDYLQKRQEPWLCFFPQEDCSPVNNENHQKWLQTAARLRSGLPNGRIVLDQALSIGISNYRIGIVSSYGCPGILHLTEILTSHGFSPHIISFPVEEAPKQPQRSWWMRQEREPRYDSRF